MDLTLDGAGGGGHGVSGRVFDRGGGGGGSAVWSGAVLASRLPLAAGPMPPKPSMGGCLRVPMSRASTSCTSQVMHKCAHKRDEIDNHCTCRRTHTLLLQGTRYLRITV